MSPTARTGEIAINFLDLGRGRPLIMLHGYSLDGRTWQEMGYVAPLVESGFRPILVDIRGHGSSGKPQDPGAYSDESQAQDVVGVLDTLGIGQADIMGYSRGGRMALAVAVLHPDRVGKLVIGGAHPFSQDMSQFRLAVRDRIDDWIAVVDHFGGPLPDALRERIAANDIEALRAAVAVDRPDISGSLSGFTHQCLFFAGSDDPLMPEARRAAELLPQARMVEIADCNHITALQRADLVLPHVIPFLQAR